MNTIKLSSDDRVLFLTKDLELIKKQLYDGLNLKMRDLSEADLLDDINTDVMTPAWVCFDYRPSDIAVNAYAGLMHKGERVFTARALMDGGFKVIVSGQRKGTGSSRETAAQCERWSGIRIAIAASFAPIHERNNINLGQLMGGYDLLMRLQDGEALPLSEFTKQYDDATRLIIESGGLFQFSKKMATGELKLKTAAHGVRPMTMIEKLVARKSSSKSVQPGDVVFAQVDGGYSHEFTSAQVHEFLIEEFGENYTIKNADKFAVFEDHLIYADGVAKMRPFKDKIELLRVKQREFQAHTKVKNFSAEDGISPGICHEVAREKIIEPGDFIQATDSHTCMGGALNALAYGVGATEYAALIYSGSTLIQVPQSIRFNLVGTLPASCMAKDIMLHILATYAKNEQTLNRCMEFGGPGLLGLSADERATLCNMATECTARTGICEGDEGLLEWLTSARGESHEAKWRASFVAADSGAIYDGGVHTIDLSSLRPMVAHPGDPDKGIPSDPTNGAFVDDIGHVKIDICYGGSCTAGKVDDIRAYAQVVGQAVADGLKVHDGVRFYIQTGSKDVMDYAREQGWIDLFERAGVIVLNPGCGACIGCGPGVSDTGDQVTVSAINRNFQGRSGPGKLYLASPLTVAASAFAGYIKSYGTKSEKNLTR
jgi:3-isopropylmalate/(R)-2-methylmalate dehydratase large subunit